jgi:hypothetical protein
MAHVAFHGFDKVWNEIGPALQLHINARPSFIDHLPGLDQLVVDGDGVKAQKNHNPEKDPADSHNHVSHTINSYSCEPGLFPEINPQKAKCKQELEGATVFTLCLPLSTNGAAWLLYSLAGWFKMASDRHRNQSQERIAVQKREAGRPLQSGAGILDRHQEMRRKAHEPW